MRDHHNIFFYYRGAHQSQAERDRQIENNTTKALINILELSAAPVRRAFLEWVGITATEPILYELQRLTIGQERLRDIDQRLLLGLVPAQADTEPPASPTGAGIDQADSLPDAWIYGKDFAVLLENKIVGSLDAAQWEAHNRRLRGGSRQVPIEQVCTWTQVYTFFKALPQNLAQGGVNLDVQSLFLISQFTEYLELIGMGKFTGIDSELFDYFLHADDDIKPRVRGVMTTLAQEVLVELQQALGQEFYQNFRVGNLWSTDDHAWAAFGPKDKGYLRVAHQTVAMDAHGLEVFVNVELADAAARLRKRIRDDRQLFRDLLTNMLPGESFYVELQERTPKQASIFDYHPVDRVEAAYLRHPAIGAKAFDFIEAVIEQLHLPYFTLRNRIDRAKVAELSKDQGRPLVAEVVRLMKEFDRLVSFINA
jgi:hypothetical protein